MTTLTWDELAAKLRDVADDTTKAVLEGEKEVAARILAEAKDRAPVQTGRLRDSGRVRVEGEEVRVEFTMPYAATVHEDPASSGHKFLEDAVKDASKSYADDVAEAARKHTRGGRG